MVRRLTPDVSSPAVTGWRHPMSGRAGPNPGGKLASITQPTASYPLNLNQQRLSPTIVATIGELQAQLSAADASMDEGEEEDGRSRRMKPICLAVPPDTATRAWSVAASEPRSMRLPGADGEVYPPARSRHIASVTEESRCTVCGAAAVPAAVPVIVRRDGREVMRLDVPARACESCGWVDISDADTEACIATLERESQPGDEIVFPSDAPTH